MWHDFHDKTFKHKPAKWWQIINVVKYQDFTGSVGGNGTLYDVYSLMIWSLEIQRVAVESNKEWM